MANVRDLIESLASRADIEISCETDGKTIRLHSLKLALASPVLADLMDNTMDDGIMAAKRQRASNVTTGWEGGSTTGGGAPLPKLKVIKTTTNWDAGFSLLQSLIGRSPGLTHGKCVNEPICQAICMTFSLASDSTLAPWDPSSF